jgi:protocatechuate 4,5-dioxygenase beta chain
MQFLDLLESDPERLTELSRGAYIDGAGAEAVELIMWLTMRGALNPTVHRVHRFYQMPVSLTAAGLVAFEN